MCVNIMILIYKNNDSINEYYGISVTLICKQGCVVID